MSKANSKILVNMWVGDNEEEETKFIGQREIDANHKDCYDGGEFLFSKCSDKCDVWVCHSHEEIDHVCEVDEDIECERTEGEDCTCGECNHG